MPKSYSYDTCFTPLRLEVTAQASQEQTLSTAQVYMQSERICSRPPIVQTVTGAVNEVTTQYRWIDASQEAYCNVGQSLTAGLNESWQRGACNLTSWWRKGAVHEYWVGRDSRHPVLPCHAVLAPVCHVHTGWEQGRLWVRVTAGARV